MTQKILSEIGKDLPTASVNKMIVGKTSIDVELVVKDQLDDELNGTWFSNEKLGNLLKLVVVMSKSEEATKIMSLGSDATSLCDKTVGKLERESLVEEVIRLTNPSLLSRSRRGLTREKRRILKLIDENTEVKFLNLSKDFKGSFDDVIRSEKQEIEGQEVTNVYYGVRYDLEPDEDHVSVFSYVKMDIREFGERFDIDTSSSGLDSFTGEVNLEKVITSREIVRRSRVFFQNGRLFNGPVRYSMREGRYQSDDRVRTRLDTRIVRNPKIIDEREIMSLGQIRTEFDNLSFSIVSDNSRTRDNMNSKIKPSYFSPLFHTKDENDNIRFMFSIDTSEILTRNSIYGPLFSKLSFSKRQDILARVLIRNLEVRRVRVKSSVGSSNKLGAGQNKSVVFDKEVPPTVLASIGEKTPRSVSPVENGSVSLSEEDTFLSINRGDISLRTFSGIDKTFSNITDGFYQYEVSVEVTDTIKEYLEEQISDLRNSISTLNDYYNFSTVIGPTLEKAEISNPHIDLEVESGTTEGEDKSHYEAFSNKFTRRFYKSCVDKYKTPMNYPWVSVPATFVDLVSGFTSGLDRKTKERIVSSMRHSMSPVTGNPTNIMRVMKMIESFTSKVEDISKISIKPSIPTTSLNSSTQKATQKTSKAPTKSFSAYKRFDETFDSNTTRSFGFNYIDPDLGSENDTGLKKVTNFDFQERVDLETERFFSDKEADISLSMGTGTVLRKQSVEDTSYGFLTPLSFLDSRVVYDFTDTTPRRRTTRFRRRGISGQSKINTFSFLLERIVTDSKAKDTLDRNNILSNENSVTITPVGDKDFSYYPEQKRVRKRASDYHRQASVVELYDYLAKEKATESGTAGSSTFLNMKSSRIKKDKRNPFKTARVLKRSGRNSISIMNLEGEQRVISTSRYSGMPNQIKSIFLRTVKNNSDVVTGEFLEDMVRNYNFEGSLEYKFTVGKIAKMHYLSGYRQMRKSGQISKVPIWRPLNKRVVDRLSGKSVLCKLSPHHDMYVGYSQTPGLNTNVYNEYFVLDVQRDVVAPLEDLPDTDQQPFTQRRDMTAPAEGDGAEDTKRRMNIRPKSGISLVDMTPKQISEIDLSNFSDEEIGNLNALQLAGVPEAVRNRLSRKRTKISVNNLMCLSLSEERESEEFRNASAKTAVVPRRSIRKVDKKKESNKDVM